MPQASPTREAQAPDNPTDLPRQSWPQTLKRTGKQFSEDKLTTWAAALTYYGVLSIFPALLALVSILGLIGNSGMTLGGRVLGVKVVDRDGQQPSYGTAAIRWIGSYLSAFILFIGYLMAFWDKNKQTLHDKMAGTLVVKV